MGSAYPMFGLGLVGVVMRRWGVFIQRPMSATLLACVVLVLVTPRLLAWHWRG